MNHQRMTAVNGGTGATSTPANNVGSSARRGSGSPTTKFAGLVNQKRNSQDAAAQARRASFHDMKPEPGFIGKMWHNFTKG